MAHPADIVEWYKEDLGRFAPLDTHCLVGGSESKIKLQIFTDNNRYTIIATESHGDGYYLGCTVSSRKPRAGEGWTRGNDMPDGKLSRELWDRIVKEIVSYELVRISQYVIDNPDAVCAEEDIYASAAIDCQSPAPEN